ncbi:MAG: hypothetical protein PHR43_01400 [Dehalococcoidales bacterium]|nr:hypothetical protein [Dehalococcoidales bacterium]
MNKTNKWLVIWNIVLTILLIPSLLGGCTGSDPRIDWLVTQVQAQAATIGNIQAQADQNRQSIQNYAVQLSAVNNYVQTSIAQLQQYVQAVMATK